MPSQGVPVRIQSLQGDKGVQPEPRKINSVPSWEHDQDRAAELLAAALPALILSDFPDVNEKRINRPIQVLKNTAEG